MTPSTGHGLRRRPGRCSSPALSLRTGSRRHRISTAFQVPGRRVDSFRIGRYANFLDTTSKSIHAGESHEVSEAKAAEVTESLESVRLHAAAKTARKGCEETLAYTDFPMWRLAEIRTDNAIRQIYYFSQPEPQLF